MGYPLPEKKKTTDAFLFVLTFLYFRERYKCTDMCQDAPRCARMRQDAPRCAKGGWDATQKPPRLKSRIKRVKDTVGSIATRSGFK